MNSRFTDDFEEQVAYLAQKTDKTSVVGQMAIAWRTVGRIIARVMGRKRPEDPLAELTVIGVDELSYRKQHHYLTMVTDHLAGNIVWATEGKTADALRKFFDDLGDERCKAIEVVTMDMSAAFKKAVSEALPQAEIVFDRYHVQSLVNEALDETRREEWRRLRGIDQEAAKALKGMRWPLLKNPWNLTLKQEQRLAQLQENNERLYRGYLLKESIAGILDRLQPNVAERELHHWIAWATRSRLPAFVKVARTIRDHLGGIVAYIRWRLTNGLVEGLNNKARLLTRRAFGFHSANAVIAMIMLCCTGLHLQPIAKKICF